MVIKTNAYKRYTNYLIIYMEICLKLKYMHERFFPNDKS